MTIYTKTQLIDLAIDKLGETPDWENYRDIAVSTDKNERFGFGEFDICNREFVDNVYWQLVCTRQEFEQRVAERKASKPVEDNTPKPTIEWEYCPECGSYEVSYEEGVHKQCADCNQEWFSDIDYTDVVRSHLQDNYLGEAKPNNDWWDYENDKALSFPPAGAECEINFMGTWTKTLIIGFGSDGSCIYEHDLLGLKYYFPIEVGDINVFRPLPTKPKLTERQQAGLKLWRAINYNDPMIDDEVLGYCRFEDYCRPFDQGLLK